MARAREGAGGGPTFASRITPGGHRAGEVSSALQKTIRRGLEEEALYWASELELAGYGAYVWKRLKIISSEDVGLADPNVSVQVKCLFDNWVEMGKTVPKNELRQPGRLFMVQAILILCRAPKSRLVDHAKLVFFDLDRHTVPVRPVHEVPDYALDKHTAAGVRKGRGWEHFFEEGTLLANEARIDDPYRDRAVETLTGERPRRRRASRKRTTTARR